MSDKDKNKELEDALLSEQVEDGFLDDLEDIEENGLDDFITSDLDDDDLDSDGDLDSDDDLDSDGDLDSGDDNSGIENDFDELSELDDEIEDLDSQLDDLDNQLDDPSEEPISSKPSGSDNKNNSDKKKFKLKPFHIAAGVFGVAAIFVVGSKIMPTSDTPVIKQPITITKLPKVDIDSDISKDIPQDIIQNVKPKPLIEVTDPLVLLSKQTENPFPFDEKGSAEGGSDGTSNVLNNLPEAKDSMADMNASAEDNDSLFDILTKDRKKVEGIYIKTLTTDGDIIIAEGQKGQMLTLDVGSSLTHYDETLRVDNILLGGEFALLSDGYYMDMTKSPLDESRLLDAKNNAERLKQERLAAERKRQNDIEKMISAAIAIEKDKLTKEYDDKIELLEKNNAVLQTQSIKGETPKAEKGTLLQAIDRIEQIESSINEPKQPTLLTGWSINASFKVKRDGFVVNGYLIKNAYGDFYKVTVGDQFENYGIVKGYDDNGKFFIGNHYIL